MKNKSIQTTIAGIVAGIILLALTAALLLKKIEVEQYCAALGGVSAFAIAVLGALSKDANKTGLPE